MAFIKPFDFNNTGAVAEYWRLTHIQVDRIAGMLSMQVHGYLDQIARDTGKNPIAHVNLTVPLGSLPDPNAISAADLYAAARIVPGGEGEPPFFADAIDV